MAVAPASELVALPRSGRRFVAEQAVRLGDVDPDGVLRLDATAWHIEAVSLWIQVDPTTGRPTGLGDEFHRIYDESAAGRVVSRDCRCRHRPRTWSPARG